MEDSMIGVFEKDGRNYVVRFFDCGDSRDLRDLRLATESPEALRWMDDTDDLTFKHYQAWMDCRGERNKFLFAVADLPDENRSDDRVHGFIYVYPSEVLRGYLEVSYARRPDAPHGLTVPAMEIALNYVNEYLGQKMPWATSGLKILAEIERGNESSIKVIEKAGFKKTRDFDRSGNALWERDLISTVYQAKTAVESKPMEMTGTKLKRVRQLNNCYCGPATLQILLSHFGIESDQHALVDAATTREHVMRKGISIELLALAIKNSFSEYRLWAKRDASLFDLEKMVRTYNYPVGVDWQGIFEEDDYEGQTTLVEQKEESDNSVGDAGHYSVIIDVEPTKYVRLMDPYGHFSEKDRLIEVQNFLNRWWDDRVDKMPDGTRNYVYEKRLMFIIVPKNVRVGEELGMVEI